MAIQFTAGQPLTANTSTPGVKNFWVNTARILTHLPITGGPVTAFTTVGGTGTWVSLECADAEGDWSSPATAGSGGLEYLLAGNYRVGGLTQEKLTQIDLLLQSSRVSVIAEGRDGVFTLLTRNGATFATAGTASGVGAAGAVAIGTPMTFTASDREAVAIVIVATDLATITDA